MMFETEYECLNDTFKGENLPLHTTNSNGENGVIYHYNDPVMGEYYQRIAFQNNGEIRIKTNYKSGLNEEFIFDGKSVRKVF